MRRVQEVEFNFDSLMDVVTNLAGGLILLVVLLLALTKPVSQGVKDVPVAERKVGGEKPMDPLLDATHSLQETLKRIDQDLQIMRARLPELETEIAGLGQSAAQP